jgi:hypothetical protein
MNFRKKLECLSLATSVTLTFFLLNQISPNQVSFNAWFVVRISHFQKWFDEDVLGFQIKLFWHIWLLFSKIR